jgi:hypothetical protein
MDPGASDRVGHLASNTAGRAAVGVVCIFGFVLVALLTFYAASPWLDHKEIPFFGSRLRDSALFAFAAAASMYVTVSLARGRLWAWWSALAVAVATLSVAIFFLFASLHPRDDFARSEGGFGLFVSFCLMIPGLISTALLALPPVRRRF